MEERLFNGKERLEVNWQSFCLLVTVFIKIKEMKKILLFAIAIAFGMSSHAQFDGIVVEEVKNGGDVPGTTYQVFVKVKNEGDGVDLVFGAPGAEMNIESTKPFFQHKDGGFSSLDISEEMIAMDPTLKYDSYVTIGRTDDKDNSLMIFQVEGKVNLDTKPFEAGKSIYTDDGAWYVIPFKPQSKAGADKKILVMQLTTKGKVTGKFNLQGKTAQEVNWREDGVIFTCGE